MRDICVIVLVRSYEENLELCRKTECHTYSVKLPYRRSRSVDGRRGARWRVSDFTFDLSYKGVASKNLTAKSQLTD